MVCGLFEEFKTIRAVTVSARVGGMVPRHNQQNATTSASYASDDVLFAGSENLPASTPTPARYGGESSEVYCLLEESHAMMHSEVSQKRHVRANAPAPPFNSMSLIKELLHFYAEQVWFRPVSEMTPAIAECVLVPCAGGGANVR